MVESTYSYYALVFQVLVIYLKTQFLTDLYELIFLNDLVIWWNLPFYLSRLDFFYEDSFDYLKYYNINNKGVMLLHLWLTFFTALIYEDTMASLYYSVMVKNKPIYYNLFMDASFIHYFLNFVFFFIILNLIINLMFYIKSNQSYTKWINNVYFTKVINLIDSEEELGSIDDFTFIFTFFVVILGWFFTTIILYVYVLNTSFQIILGTFIVLSIFILLIPLTTLIEFGIRFSSYIRGAASSKNLIIEALFDSLSVFIIFLRFIVQNIRFVLVFAAYFEFFEWVYLNKLVTSFSNIFLFNGYNFFNELLDNDLLFSIYGFFLISVLLLNILLYCYYIIHLILLIFIQIGIYFLISFWLFFFFYTSFALTTKEKVFLYKRYL